MNSVSPHAAEPAGPAPDANSVYGPGGNKGVNGSVLHYR